MPAVVLHQAVREEEPFMAGVMIGVDPHRASHAAVAIGGAEEPLGQLRVRACAAQAERLLEYPANSSSVACVSSEAVNHRDFRKAAHCACRAGDHWE